MGNEIGLQQRNRDDYLQEGNNQSGGARMHQSTSWRSRLVEEKLRVVKHVPQIMWQRCYPIFPPSQTDAPLPHKNLLRNSIPLLNTNKPFQKIRRLYFARRKNHIAEKEGRGVALKNIQDLERYDPARFVNRIEELESVEERVLAFQRGEVVKQPLINFWGIADIGKTWLLKEIEHRYQYDPSQARALQKPTCTIYYDFNQPDLTVTAVAQSLLQSVADSFSDPLLTSERKREITQLTQTDKVEEIVTFIISLTVELVPILLFDTTEYVDDDLWAELESQLFEPLLKSNKILLIVTGRNRAPRWKRVEVRRRATPVEKSQVQPFDKKTTKEQLVCLGLSSDVTQDIFDDSAGAPGLTAVLGFHRAHLPTDRYLQERTNQWDRYVDDIFEHLSQLSESFAQMVTAVTPLRYYRTQALRNMLKGTTNYKGDTSDVYLLRTLRKLDKQSHLVWWDDQQNAYVTALAARRILNRRLQVKAPARFMDLHSFALEMYRQWAKEYQTSLPAYLPELLFHEATIYRAKNLLPDNEIHAADYIAMLDEMNIDNRDILHRRLEQDTELQTLIPELFKKISSHLEETVGSVEG